MTVPSLATIDVSQDAAAWDQALASLSGHLLQSWKWGEFKSLHGWDVRRIAYPEAEPRAMAQVLLRRRGPISIAYIPRGPACRSSNPDCVRELFKRVDELCRAERAIYVTVEPNEPLPFTGTYKSEGFVKGGPFIQPGRTVKIPLLPDELLLKQMRQNTRYSVRLAQRRGVEVLRLGDGPTIGGDFYDLLLDTAERNEFGVHSRAYYEDFVRIFGDDALTLFARADGEIAAALIAAKFGNEAMYMYGASSTQHRAHGAAFLLQFETMRWARQAGCERYDLWGITLQDPDIVHEDGTKFATSRGEDWRGIYRFKTGFGGEIVSFPEPIERRYNRVLSVLAHRIVDRHRSDG